MNSSKRTLKHKKNVKQNPQSLSELNTILTNYTAVLGWPG